MKKTVSETKLYRSEMNEKILKSGFRDFNKFFALDNKAYINGAEPPNTSSAITVTVVVRSTHGSR